MILALVIALAFVALLLVLSGAPKKLFLDLDPSSKASIVKSRPRSGLFGLRLGDFIPRMQDSSGVVGLGSGLKVIGWATVTAAGAGGLTSTGQGLIMARTGAGTYTATVDTTLGGASGGPFGSVTDPLFFVMSLTPAAPIVDAAITSTSVLTIHTNTAVATPGEAATGFMVLVFAPAISEERFF